MFNQLVYHERDIYLCFRVVAIGLIEVDELFLDFSEKHGRESPEVHGNHIVLVEGDAGVHVLDCGTFPSDFGTLRDAGQEIVLVHGAYSTGYRTVFRQGSCQAVTGKAETSLVRVVCHEIMHFHESVPTVEVVSIDGDEWLVDTIFCRPDGVSRPPRFFPLDGRHIAGQTIHFLETVHRFHQALRVFSHGFLEFSLETAADDEHDFVESGVHGIVDGIV